VTNRTRNCIFRWSSCGTISVTCVVVTVVIASMVVFACANCRSFVPLLSTSTSPEYGQSNREIGTVFSYSWSNLPPASITP